MEIQNQNQTIEIDSFQVIGLPEKIHGINTTRQFLVSLSTEEFIDLVKKNQQFPSFQQWMNYYLWLFRDDSDFQQILSSPLFPTKFLIQFIYYALGRWIAVEDNDPDEFFMDIATLFSPEKCLQILIEENIVELDVNLALAFISNLDENGINVYFEQTGNREDETNFFYDLFSELEDTMIKSFFIKNPELYNYILQMFKKEKDRSELHQKKYERFVEKFKTDLDIIDLTLSIKEKVHTIFDLEEEKKKPCSQRNLKRIIGIINALKGKDNISDIVQILYRQKTIIDREEKDLIRNILTDDFLKSIFKLSDNIQL